MERFWPAFYSSSLIQVFSWHSIKSERELGTSCSWMGWESSFYLPSIIFFFSLSFLKERIKHNGGLTGILRNDMIPFVFKARISFDILFSKPESFLMIALNSRHVAGLIFQKHRNSSQGRADSWLRSRGSLSPQGVLTASAPGAGFPLLLTSSPGQPFLGGGSDSWSISLL